MMSKFTEALLEQIRLLNQLRDHALAAFNEVNDENRRLRAENLDLRRTLERIAAHDFQALAMDALRPNERIRDKR